MSLGRYFRGVNDSIKQLPSHWQGDMETGFPARIKAVREERLVKLLHDMYRTLKREDKPYRIYGLREKLEQYEDRMEALEVEVDG